MPATRPTRTRKSRATTGGPGTTPRRRRPAPTGSVISISDSEPKHTSNATRRIHAISASSDDEYYSLSSQLTNSIKDVKSRKAPSSCQATGSCRATSSRATDSRRTTASCQATGPHPNSGLRRRSSRINKDISAERGVQVSWLEDMKAQVAAAVEAAAKAHEEAVTAHEEAATAKEEAAKVSEELMKAKQQAAKAQEERLTAQQDAASAQQLALTLEHIKDDLICEVRSANFLISFAISIFFSISCGHTFCRSCLARWLDATLTKFKKSHRDYNPREAPMLRSTDDIALPESLQHMADEIELEMSLSPPLRIVLSTMLHIRRLPPYACPVCRKPVIRKPVPNYVLGKVIESGDKIEAHAARLAARPYPPTRPSGDRVATWSATAAADGRASTPVALRASTPVTRKASTPIARRAPTPGPSTGSALTPPPEDPNSNVESEDDQLDHMSSSPSRDTTPANSRRVQFNAQPIPRPEGSAGRPHSGGYTLRTKMMIGRKSYSSMQIISQWLHHSCTVTKQPPKQLERAKELILQKYPDWRTKYEDAWPVDDLIARRLAYTTREIKKGVSKPQDASYNDNVKSLQQPQ
ncbi:hypothetical protein PUNSTDRAFT_44261 [Punctularia strigosozonata HHB-11173 SS5]|uniref:uncharacterized protein n=1 Tax=Punctularia strigosozonata (strain HHB-11173) TaxID=741275 RepID=UPI0004418684|nr:uncharacterized protein PUNSTDRAFT_44261 [Punctularia strigosozonata HHB-11173 SS5]EIN10107.1 hypothetical protein PUNSTDRAFT_44261 [Punctularia strigosozonata HHB-11173 SS5]